MLNKSECSKKFKKIFDKTVYTTKKDIRTAKSYSKMWNNYSSIKDIISLSTKQVNSVNLVLQRKIQNVEELQQLDKDREHELEQLKEEIKVLQEKIQTIESTESRESEKYKSQQQKLLHQHVLKDCTKMYINDKKIPHLLRGFTTNEGLEKTIPFEIDPDRLTGAEIENAVWDYCQQSSEFTNEWSHLFAETDGIN